MEVYREHAQSKTQSNAYCRLHEDDDQRADTHLHGSIHFRNEPPSFLGFISVPQPKQTHEE